MWNNEKRAAKVTRKQDSRATSDVSTGHKRAFRTLAFVGLLLVLVLSACGGAKATPTLVPTSTPLPTPTPVPTDTPRPSEPVDVVENVIAAMQELDLNKASKYFCSARKSELDDALASSFEELEAMGLDPDELLDAIQLDMKDMAYEEQSRDGDNAVVHVSGSLSLAFDTDKLRSFLKQATEAAGETVTDEELDLVVGLFITMAGQEAPIDGEVELIKEDGDWVICDDLDFLNEIDTGF